MNEEGIKVSARPILVLTCFILIEKRRVLGFKNNFILWLIAYIWGRKQYVRFNNCQSEIFNVSSAVPQGSHLVPLLFILFINDLLSVLNNCKCLLFADDLKIFRAITNVNVCLLLQNVVSSKFPVINCAKISFRTFLSIKCKFFFWL